MLQVKIPGIELYDEEKNLFTTIKDTTLALEHSLVSLSKWEAKWHKHFLGSRDITPEEYLDYIRCMTITKNVDPMIYQYIPDSIIREIQAYLDDPMTATVLPKETGGSNGTFVTSELIYYWMTCYNIPFEECQKWHLNRLLTLINVAVNESKEKKPMSQAEVLAQNRMLNEQRRLQYKTKG